VEVILGMVCWSYLCESRTVDLMVVMVYWSLL